MKDDKLLDDKMSSHAANVARKCATSFVAYFVLFAAVVVLSLGPPIPNTIHKYNTIQY